MVAWVRGSPPRLPNLGSTLSKQEESKIARQEKSAALIVRFEEVLPTLGRVNVGFRPTPAAKAIVVFLSEHEGEPLTKSAIAAAVGRSEKTVDRLISKLRVNGYVVSEERWAQSGAQLANTYRLDRD